MIENKPPEMNILLAKQAGKKLSFYAPVRPWRIQI
jgi:hypothetical protein